MQRGSNAWSTARPWSFTGDGALFRLVSEAQRIRLAHLFDPVLAVHASDVEPLPHQITAVYDEMLPRQPLRFLLADDPGAGKTIMAGLLIRELMARGDLARCLIVCPGSLAEQWQDELETRFQLPFEILSNEKLATARTGNWFLENDLVIARLDKLSRDESAQQKLQAPEGGWDLVVCDEAHKLSATFFGNKIKYTKRYRLGQLLSKHTRHFLLMTATPHNGKEEDFQLFMALLDHDRFEGRFRTGVHKAETSDLMRRMVKEKLLKFDARPLFPQRIARTLSYRLSEKESSLYEAVTAYVREEFNRAETLGDGRGKSAVGFALTLLQRRLASSPEAIAGSLRRRRERLEARASELDTLQRSGQTATPVTVTAPGALLLDEEDLENLEDAPEDEFENAEAEMLDPATAARTQVELRTEIETLKNLQALAREVLTSGTDTKWTQLAGLLSKIFTSRGMATGVAEARVPYGAGPIADPTPSAQQKLVIFTEHRDTLRYLEKRIATVLGRAEAVVTIHGSLGREARAQAQEAFRSDPQVRVLLATDAAGEGINLQRAHLMVNYDLPWNPNRLEQRFGRIHRIGQTEVCHLFNLVAADTREGEVYERLLEKLEQARNTLGGQVFDVLGKLQFEGRPLRDLLLDAIRYGERADVRARLETAVLNAFDPGRIQALLEERALAPSAMDTSRVQRVRADMEHAAMRRLQPHYIEAFFHEAFRRLGGVARQREPHRYELTNVPAAVRNHPLPGRGKSIAPRYERIAFEKSRVVAPQKALAAFVCPGHPLLDAVLALTLERHSALLKRGAVLVDERDTGTEPRVLSYLEHALQDASVTRTGERRVISKRMLYVELQRDGEMRHVQYAPYLDYRPLTQDEPTPGEILERPECSWVGHELEQRVEAYAVAHVVPEHLEQVRAPRLALIEKTKAAVKERLTKEIAHWDNQAAKLRDAENAGSTGARLNSSEARKRADELHERLRVRLQELEREKQVSALPPVVTGGVLVVPLGLVNKIAGRATVPPGTPPVNTHINAARARGIVMEVERRLGFEPTDYETEKRGYDIESRIPGSGKLRFIEVKGRVSGAEDITVTRNEILCSLNHPEGYILAIVEFLSEDEHRVHYLRQPFQAKPDFDMTSARYSLRKLLERAGEPS